MKIFISITDPNGNQSVYQVGSKARIIGRSENSDIRVFDELASGRHCQVYINNKIQLIVEDIGSKNGTSFNGIKKLKHTVYVGDSILFGSSTLAINTQKTDQEALKYLTYQGNPEERKRKEMTLELEMTPAKSNAVSSNKVPKSKPRKNIQQMDKGERAKLQHERMYGDSLNNQSESTEDEKNMTFKYFLADCIDYLFAIFIFLLSFLALYLVEPKGLEYILNMNFDKLIDVSIIGFPVTGILLALLTHKLNRRNKKGSIGEKLMGIN